MELGRITPGARSWPCSQSFLLRHADVCILMECPLDLHPFLRCLPAYRGPPPPPKLPYLDFVQGRVAMGLKAPPVELSCASKNGARGKAVQGKTAEIVTIHDEAMVDMLPFFRIPDIDSVNIHEIDAVIVSNPGCMMALPYIALHPDFCGRIYATEPTAQMGELCMGEIVSLFNEHSQSFSDIPRSIGGGCLAPSPVSLLPASIRDSFNDSSSCIEGAWRSLYSMEEVQACMAKVERVRYGETVSISGCLDISALSSGSHIGSANWCLTSDRLKVAYVAASDIRQSAGTMFDTQSLLGCEALILADVAPDPGLGLVYPPPCKGATPPGAAMPAMLLNPSEGGETVGTTCRHTVAALMRGGSVLIPTGPSDSILELIELLAPHLHSNALSHIPVFFISPVADKFLKYTNIIPEWLSPQRQEKLYAAEALFGHVDIVGKRLFPLPSLHCSEARRVWVEPCVVLASHWSLRMGAVVDLLFRWRSDPLSCLILSQPGLNVPLALAPFQPIAMEVLHLPLSEKLSEQAAAALLCTTQPKHAAMPGHVMEYCARPECGPHPTTTNKLSYDTSQTVVLPLATHPRSVQMSHILASQVTASSLGMERIAGARVYATLVRRDGKWTLEPPLTAPTVSGRREPDFVWGNVELGALLRALEQRGFSGIRVKGGLRSHGGREGSPPPLGSEREGEREGGVTVVEISQPRRAVLWVSENETKVEADDTVVSQLVLEAVLSLLHTL